MIPALLAAVTVVITVPQQAPTNETAPTISSASASPFDRVAALILDAERTRLAKTNKRTPASVSWSDVVVETTPIHEVRQARFFRGYNAAVDPSWIYMVAVDEAGRPYAIGGFQESTFRELAKHWLAMSPGPTDSELVDMVAVFFRFSENWPEAAVGTTAAWQVARIGSAFKVTGRLRDAKSGRSQNVVAELSMAHGFRILVRKVLARGHSVEY